MSICTNCNGKGYNTVYKGEGGYTDFGSMKYIETTPMGIQKVPCSKCKAKEDKELEKETTGQTVYEQLQEILNECIEKGWSYRFITKRDEYNDRRCSTLYVSNGEMYEDHSYVSYHDLFSKDSGLMEFVEWKPLTLQELSYHQMRSDSLDYRYMKMSSLTAEEKCNYFVNNSIIPTK